MRNLKILGLALVASLALSAMVASAASAKTAVVTGGPNVTGVDSKAEGVKTELTGLASVKCKVATYTGTAIASTITLTPSFAECAASNGAPATITVNGCAYKVTMGAVGAAAQSVELECAAGKSIEVHLYGDAKHEVPACTLTIGPQTPTVGTLTVQDVGATLTVTGTATNITSTVGGHCVTTAPFGLTHDGPIPNPIASTLHTDIIVSGGGDLETEE